MGGDGKEVGSTELIVFILTLLLKVSTRHSTLPYWLLIEQQIQHSICEGILLIC